jgi:hypothetical protein
MEPDQALSHHAAMNRLHMRHEADEEKAAAALKLIERASVMPVKMAMDIRACGYMTSTQKFERAMQLLPHLLEFSSDVDSPDVNFWRDYHELSGEHWFLSDEGWEPGENKACYLADDPTWQPDDEVNAHAINPVK